jgi:hypothetical protein
MQDEKEAYPSSNGTPIEIYTFALGKVTSKTKHGEHTSSRDFTYPIGKTVPDPNAKEGSHTFGLHLIPILDCADQLSSYGSHRLAVLPGPQLWEPPVENGEQPNRCWHSSGATTLFCLDSAGFTIADLKNPDFWQSLTKPRSRKQASSDEFVLRLPRTAVWHKEREVAQQAA